MDFGTHKCDRCGKAFKKKWHAHRFCSGKCGKRWHAKEQRRRNRSGERFPKSFDRECPECGTKFTTPWHFKVFCSKKCVGRMSDRRCHYLNKRNANDRFRLVYAKKLASSRAWHKRKAEEGMCSRCGRERTRDGLKLCGTCRVYLHG